MGTGRAGVCSSCRGAWVPFASIEAVMPRLGELAPAKDEAPAPADAAADKLKCPECGGDLVAVRHAEVRGASVRTCLVCFGRWIDGAELVRLKGGGLLSRLLGIFGTKSRPPAAGQETGAEPSPDAPASEESARTETPAEDGE